jgi:5-methylcytosine-specific restriction endonuclease McrA
MSSGKARIPDALRDRVSLQARYRCGYCLCSQELLGMPMSVDHIEPEAVGGATTEENLWLACRRCNEFKGARSCAAVW